MAYRTVFHVDMDAFFASIEIVKNPALKGKPVIVGGHPDRRGVVSTCSYEARTFGVRSAMSLSEARRRCPHAIFLEGSFSAYREYSHKIMEIFRNLTFLVEVVSIDEAYIDVTEVLNDLSPIQLAKELQQKVFQETQLTCSIGIAVNKLIAKMASAFAKPAKIFKVEVGEEEYFLAPLLIDTLPGIGEKTKISLNREGIVTIGDLQELGLDLLLQRYGARGYYYYKAAYGLDNRPVEWRDSLPKSMGAETTFDIDQSDPDIIEETIKELVIRANKDLQRHKMRAGGICLKLRDHTFKTITRSRTLGSETNDVKTLQDEFITLFHQNHEKQLPLRLVGVSLRRLTDHYWQPTFWD